ncbi:hypothetical protein COV16_02960 [Candidatus Woesearchaeota archaeon CG10_big_fil_rev_8_21_14_0_10_34_8]|nr:MAG: hypothetical protein COV16_02960 [Candidatus Woesearchaeota archaeon CG10_big_fil_rev_8_21_14_0_10_34_8]
MLQRQHTKAYNSISAELTRRVQVIFEGSYESAGERLAEVSEIKPQTAKRWIKSVCQYGPSEISGRRATQKGMQLERLAVFYGLLGIEEDHEIVGLTQSINSQFQYPFPKYETIDCRVEINLPDGYDLKPEQVKHLERLATLYAVSNK